MSLETITTTAYPEFMYATQTSVPVYMTAVVGPNGETAVEQLPGERWSAQDDNDLKNKFPREAQGRIKDQALTGQYVDQLYQNLMASETGHAYVDRLKAVGNGKANPGELDVIATVGSDHFGGAQAVAATYPDHPKANLLLNSDILDQYCRSQAALYGLGYDDVLEGILLHELNHYFGQTRDELNQHELLVELNNDTDLVEFFMDRANATDNLGTQQKYVRLANMFADRYQGMNEQNLKDYILEHAPEGYLQTVTPDKPVERARAQDLWDQFMDARAPRPQDLENYVIEFYPIYDQRELATAPMEEAMPIGYVATLGYHGSIPVQVSETVN